MNCSSTCYTFSGLSRFVMRSTRLAVLIAVCCSAPAFADGDECGELKNAYGPFDYRTIPETNRELVESAHFTPDVERLIKGSSGYLAGDIDYTLRAIPNHHRALVSMANLSLREGSDRPRGARYSMTCWFDRAFRMAPDDGKVRAVFGYYLSRKSNLKGAAEQFKLALDLGQDDGNTHYNFGLVLFNLKQYDEALQHAKAAEARGFPLKGLQTKLQSIGKWTE